MCLRADILGYWQGGGLNKCYLKGLVLKTGKSRAHSVEQIVIMGANADKESLKPSEQKALASYMPNKNYSQLRSFK